MKKLQISFGFCGMTCFLLWLNLQIGSCFLLGTIVHELGHLLTMVILRVSVYGVSLTIAGAQIRSGPMSNAKEALCALAGPFSNMVLGAFVLHTMSQLAIVNFCLAAVNLLPLYPLDGGRILLCVLRTYLTEKRLGQVMQIVNTVVCVLLMISACWAAIYLQAGLWPIFTALALLWRAGNQENYCISWPGRIK